jgi:hypothetical protein
LRFQRNARIGGGGGVDQDRVVTSSGGAPGVSFSAPADVSVTGGEVVP